MLSDKKTAIAVLGLLLLSGCGFQPLYGDHGAATGAQLSGVAVDQIADRMGVVMTDRLRDQMSSTPEGIQPQYRLGVHLDETVLGMGTLPDGTAAFTTVTVKATWRLRDYGTDHVVDNGIITASAGYDVLNDNYANVVAQSSREDRVVEELTAQIEERVALYLKTHPSNS